LRNNTGIDYNTEGKLLYSTTSDLVTWGQYEQKRKFNVYDPKTNSLLYIIEADASVESEEWSYSNTFVHDTAGRIFIADSARFFVFGCPLGQAVIEDGTCASRCIAGFRMENNICRSYPELSSYFFHMCTNSH
jgi:hypothetical protein